MEHRDHVALLRPGVPEPAPGERPLWADMGAGEGAFTLALADLLGPGATIIAVDRDPEVLRTNQRAVRSQYPGVDLQTLEADLTSPFALPPLDGVVLANSLHFVPRMFQVEAVRRVVRLLKPGGRLLLVEYDADRGNPWVPHPMAYPSWQAMAEEAGLVETTRIGRVPSRFLEAIYSAVSRRPEEPDELPGPLPNGPPG